MSVQTIDSVSTSLKDAIETRNSHKLADLYASEAVVRVIDRNNPPSKPREIKGRSAISTFWDDICSRTMTHKVDTQVTEGNHLAFTQDCTYPDGTKVFCMAMVDLKDGQIARQTVIQAWDE
ncbi:MAG: nuclear transport factor 2 family protein [Phyllobacterium sp.]